MSLSVFCCNLYGLDYEYAPAPDISSVQSLDRLGHRGDIGEDSAEIPFQSCEQFGVGRHVHSLMLSISSADHGVAHPPWCTEGWFCRGCRGVGHARAMQVSVSWYNGLLICKLFPKSSDAGCVYAGAYRCVYRCYKYFFLKFYHSFF